MSNTRPRFVKHALRYVLVVYLAIFTTAETQAQEIKAISMSDIGGILELGYIFRDEERARNDADTSSSVEELRLNQRLQLELDGYIMHPRFMELQLNPEIEWEQQKITTMDQQSVDSNNTNFGGELRVGILKDSYFPSSVFWSKKRREIDQLFSKSNKVTHSLWGGTFQLRKGPLPIKIHYQHSDLNGSGNASDSDESSNELTISSRYRLGTRSSGNIHYNLMRLDQKAFNRVTTNHRLTLSNTTFLDEDKKRRMDGHASILDQSGYINNRTILFQENISWKHTDKLWTRYGLSGSSRDTNSDVLKTANANFGLSHQLYNSLFTNINLNAGKTDSSLQKSKTLRASLLETYTKELGNWGHWTINAKIFADVYKIDSRVDTGEVIDESVYFNSSGSIPLSENNIVSDTIRVTDENSLKVYREDIDYSINQVNLITLITRLPLGDIPNDSTVLVSYRFDLGSNREVLTLGTSLGTRISWKEWLSGYAQWDQSDQKSLSGDTSSDEDDLEELDRYSLGAQANWKWFGFRVDHTRQHSTLTPFESMSEHVSASTSLTERLQVQFSITHQLMEYFDTNENIDSWNGQSTLHGQLNRRTQFELEVRYRIQDFDSELSTNNNDIEGYGLRGSLQWQFRTLVAEIDALWSEFDQQSQTEDKVALEVRLTRRF